MQDYYPGRRTHAFDPAESSNKQAERACAVPQGYSARPFFGNADYYTAGVPGDRSDTHQPLLLAIA